MIRMLVLAVVAPAVVMVVALAAALLAGRIEQLEYEFAR
jgi:hypothetical protein